MGMTVRCDGIIGFFAVENRFGVHIGGCTNQRKVLVACGAEHTARSNVLHSRKECGNFGRSLVRNESAKEVM